MFMGPNNHYIQRCKDYILYSMNMRKIIRRKEAGNEYFAAT